MASSVAHICPVCFEGKPVEEVRWMPCGHGFCLPCINSLFSSWRSYASCPQCRRHVDRSALCQIYLQTEGSQAEDEKKKLKEQVEVLTRKIENLHHEKQSVEAKLELKTRQQVKSMAQNSKLTAKNEELRSQLFQERAKPQSHSTESILEQDRISYLKELLQICEQAMLQRTPNPNQLNHTDITSLRQAFQILQENLSPRAQEILGLTSTPTHHHQDHHHHHQDHHHHPHHPPTPKSPLFTVLRLPTTSSTSTRVLRKPPPPSPSPRELTDHQRLFSQPIDSDASIPVHGTAESHPTLNEEWDNWDSADPDFAIPWFNNLITTPIDTPSQTHTHTHSFEVHSVVRSSHTTTGPSSSSAATHGTGTRSSSNDRPQTSGSNGIPRGEQLLLFLAESAARRKQERAKESGGRRRLQLDSTSGMIHFRR